MKKTRKLRRLDPDPRRMTVRQIALAVGFVLECSAWPTREQLRKLERAEKVEA